MCTYNSLVTNILQNIFFYVPQKKRKSYRFETTWEWLNYDIITFLWWTVHLTTHRTERHNKNLLSCDFKPCKKVFWIYSCFFPVETTKNRYICIYIFILILILLIWTRCSNAKIIFSNTQNVMKLLNILLFLIFSAQYVHVISPFSDIHRLKQLDPV